MGEWHMVWGVFSGNSKLGNTIPEPQQVHKLLEGILGMTGLFEAYFQLNVKIISQDNKTEYCLFLFSYKSLFGAASPGQGDNGN